VRESVFPKYSYSQALLSSASDSWPSKYSVNVLFWDQWDFLDSFFGHNPTLAQLFVWQHGPHREGLGLTADAILYPLTDWNVRIECLMIGGCVVAATALAIILKKRLFGRLDYWDVLIPILFLALAQFEGMTTTPNPAYSAFPLLLVMLYLLALLIPNDLVKYCLVCVVNFLLIYTGFGVFMGVVTIGVFGFFCYRRLRGFDATPMAMPFAGLFIACISLALFFIHYIFQPAVDCFVFPYSHPGHYIWFVALMFANVTGIGSHIVLAAALGPVLVLCSIFVLGVHSKVLVRAARLSQTSLVIVILMTYSLTFAINTAIGRVCLGLPGSALPSRYCTLLIPRSWLSISTCARRHPASYGRWPSRRSYSRSSRATVGYPRTSRISLKKNVLGLPVTARQKTSLTVMDLPNSASIPRPRASDSKKNWTTCISFKRTCSPNSTSGLAGSPRIHRIPKIGAA
jgi:hypothetical protein